MKQRYCIAAGLLAAVLAGCARNVPPASPPPLRPDVEPAPDISPAPVAKEPLRLGPSEHPSDTVVPTESDLKDWIGAHSELIAKLTDLSPEQVQARASDAYPVLADALAGRTHCKLPREKAQDLKFVTEELVKPAANRDEARTALKRMLECVPAALPSIGLVEPNLLLDYTKVSGSSPAHCIDRKAFIEKLRSVVTAFPKCSALTTPTHALRWTCEIPANDSCTDVYSADVWTERYPNSTADYRVLGFGWIRSECATKQTTYAARPASRLKASEISKHIQGIIDECKRPSN
jgi:hypothetical protein